jgi:hypothetical protein
METIGDISKFKSAYFYSTLVPADPKPISITARNSIIGDIERLRLRINLIDGHSLGSICMAFLCRNPPRSF